MMSPPAAPMTAVLQWKAKSILLSGTPISVARIEVELFLQTLATNSQPTRWIAWLDTAAPLSIVPFRIRSQGLVWHPFGVQTTWLGKPCDVGSLDVWFADRQSKALCGPYSMVAKFPRSDPSGAPSPLLIGLEFVLAHHGGFHMPVYPLDGELSIQ